MKTWSVVFCVLMASVIAGSTNPHKLVHRDAVMPVLQDDRIHGRIVGGELAKPGQFPYQVGLSLQLDNFYLAWCGGSIISNNYVLTAAHCTSGIQYVVLYFGATLRDYPEMTTTVYPNNIIIHANYNPSNLMNDISLIKSSSIAYSSLIQPIALAPANSDDFIGATAIASGWGRTSDWSNNVAAELHYVQMSVITNYLCSQTYGSTVVTSGNICTETYGGHSTCQGDSGGPLVSSGQQIGLTSFGAASGCEWGYPVAFTRVSYFRDWIKLNSGV